MSGDQAADKLESFLHHRFSELQDEIRQGFADSSAHILDEIKQLLSIGSLLPNTTVPSSPEASKGSGPSAPLQTNKDQRCEALAILGRFDTISEADSEETDTPCSEKDSVGRQPTELPQVARSVTELRRMSSSSKDGLQRYEALVARAVSDSEVYAKRQLSNALQRTLRHMRKHLDADERHQKKFLYRFVNSQTFSIICMFMILANASWMGYESDYRETIESSQLKRIALIFNIWFATELLLKLVTFRLEFFIGPDYLWNLLDLFLVLSSIPEYFELSITLSIIHILRLGRLTRAFRVVRLLRYMSTLREIRMSLFHTLAPLFWSFVAMFLLTYVWALLFMQSLGLRMDQGVQFRTDENFKSVRLSMLTLYSFFSGGMDWYPFMTDFHEHDAYLAEYALLFYIFFMNFGVLNVIIGVFCTRASEACHENREIQLDKQQRHQTKMVNDLVRVFHMIDTQGRGYIERWQFLAYAEESKTQAIFNSHGLPTFAVDKIWRVMDEYDGAADEKVNMTSFVMAFMRLSGNSISTEVMILSLRMVEVRNDMKEILQTLRASEPALKESEPALSQNQGCEQHPPHNTSFHHRHSL